MQRSILVMVLAACGSGSMVADDSGMDAASVPTFPPSVTVAATMGPLAAPFAVNASGSAAAPLGAISFTQNTGTLQEGEPANAFVYVSQEFSPYTLYQGFAVSSARWDVFWLYCVPTGLNNVYDEGIAGPALFTVPATGTCDKTLTTTTAQVMLPAFTLTAPPGIPGYAVRGDAIVVNQDGTGALEVAGVMLPLRVFGDVDCSNCGSPGWRELHSVIWDDAAKRAIFAIVYLMNADSVSVEYAQSLPDLTDPIGPQTLPATWSISPARRAPHHGGLGMPPRAYRRASR